MSIKLESPTSALDPRPDVPAQPDQKAAESTESWVELCFWILILAQVCRIWVIRYFPSQDGPSHLYNAAVLAFYHQIPAFRDFYTIHVSAAGNVLAQALQSILLRTAGELAAEKVLLTLYVVLLPLSFRALLATVTPKASPLLLMAFVILPNFFLYMGFWNFCLSIPLAFLTLVWFRRRRNLSDPLTLLLLCVLSLLTYSAHLLSWALVAIVVSLELGVDLICTWKSIGSPKAFRQPAWIAGAVYGPALLVLAYFHSMGSRLEFGGSLVQRTWPLYSAAFLRGVAPGDKWLSYAFEAIVIALLVGAGVRRFPERRLYRSDVFLLFALVCALLSTFGPAGAASGAYLRDRTAFYSWTFLVVWLAGTAWPRQIERSAAVAIAALAIACFALRIPSELSWSRQLSEYTAVRPWIAPGSTILAIQLETRFPAVDPMLHAVGLVALDGAIDLRNYEALLPYFSVQFRPEKSPDPRLGDQNALSMTPPRFDIPRYEQATGRNVDYLLVYGGAGTPELQCYPETFAGYQQVHVSQPAGIVRLYARKPLGGGV